MDSQVAATVVGNLVPQTKHSKFRSAVALSQNGNNHTLNNPLHVDDGPSVVNFTLRVSHSKAYLKLSLFETSQPHRE